MNITIHRGQQIGGCITEISHGGCKIVIDMGSNLPGSQAKEFGRTEVEQITAGADAVFYTHVHGDHLGLCHLVPNDIPQYIGPGTKEVCLIKYDALLNRPLPLDLPQETIMSMITYEVIQNMNTYEAGHPINVAGKNQIIVTPFFVDHSAFDSYMLLIQVNDLRILHTGDFRSHGYLGKGLWGTLKHHIKTVDVLITEGTALNRKADVFQSENNLQIQFRQLLQSRKAEKKTPHFFVLCTSSDIQRLATLHAACQKTHTIFLCDYFQQNILKVFTQFNQTYQEKHNKKRGMINKSLFDFSDVGENSHNYSLLQKNGFVMPVRSSQIERIKRIRKNFPESELIYSMWHGYYNGDDNVRNPKIIEILNMFNWQFHTLHTSGHASKATLEEVCRKTKPSTAIIPIHRESESDFSKLDIPDELKQRIVTETTDIPAKDLSIIFHDITASI